eukprot:6353028-Alexandrium_andersonii.AAC.1
MLSPRFSALVDPPWGILGVDWDDDRTVVREALRRRLRGWSNPQGLADPVSGQAAARIIEAFFRMRFN